jgi:large subunit ribosomal protein L15
VVVNVGALNVFKKGDAVNPVTLIAKGLIKEILGKVPVVKVLGTGEITIAIIVTGCDISETAKSKIEKAGGTITQTLKAKPQSDEQLKKIADKKAKKLDKKSSKKGGTKKK